MTESQSPHECEHGPQARLLTSTGRGAVAVVALSGQGSFAILQRFLCLPGRDARWGDRVGTMPIDRVLFARWGGPHGEEIVVCHGSDTSTNRSSNMEHDMEQGEESFEIQCHGGVAAVRAIIRDIERAGGKEVGAELHELKLSREPWACEASAVNTTWAERARAKLPAAMTEKTAAILLDQVEGALDRAVAEIASLRQAGKVERADAAQSEIDRWDALGRHLTRPWRVAIMGRPNVGKSSLLNAIVGFQRAIVWDAPGTTRDLVTSTVALDGWPVLLIDMAGLRSDADPIEREGMRLAAEVLPTADLLIVVEEVGGLQGSPSEEVVHQVTAWQESRASNLPAASHRVVPVVSKIDQIGGPAAQPPSDAERYFTPIWDALQLSTDQRVVTSLSTKTGEGLESLLDTIVSCLVPVSPGPGTAIRFC